MLSATEFDGALTDIEVKASLESLEGLHQERRQLLPEYSKLRALHGPGNKWDAKRKALLEATKVRARMVCQSSGTKYTEAQIDTMGHADEQYIAFVDEGIATATRYVELDVAMSEINERIENRTSAMYFVGQEMRLAR